MDGLDDANKGRCQEPAPHLSSLSALSIALAPGLLPGGGLQGPREGGVVVGRVLQGVVPGGGGPHALGGVLAAQ